MKISLLDSGKNFYKANLHSHSDISDGNFTPEKLKKIYKEKGYSILSITDHDGLFDHAYLNDEDFLTIAGFEREIREEKVQGEDWNDVLTCHLCMYPKDQTQIAQPAFDPDYYHPKFRWMNDEKLKAKIKSVGEYYTPNYSVESINHVISEANRYGFLVTLNHPVWSQESFEQICGYEGLFAMEIYNTGAEKLGNSEYNSALYDLLLKKGKRLCCVAADDNHNFSDETSPYCDSFGGFVMINANALTHKAVFSALENREFYSSTGPIINELYVENGYVFIKCSEAKKIRMHTHNRYSAVAIAEDKPLTEACFKLAATTEYFRIEVTDHSGEKAYTNAYFLDELK